MHIRSPSRPPRLVESGSSFAVAARSGRTSVRALWLQSSSRTLVADRLCFCSPVNAARKYSDKIPEGDSNYRPEEAVYPSRYLADKSIKLLGLTYRSLEEVTKDSLEDFKARGWL